MAAAPHHSHLIACPSFPSKFNRTRGFSGVLLWRQRRGGLLACPDDAKKIAVAAACASPLHDPLSISASALHLLDHHCNPWSSPFPPFLLAAAESPVGYSLASYYTSLGLFLISVPGLWSLIRRSVKSKIVQKAFITSDGARGKKKVANQVAGQILSFFTRNNFVVADRGEVITFEGTMAPSRGQAALLTLCTCISLASVALVLTIAVPGLGDNCYWLTILSPWAGAYYWKKASRKEKIKVKIIVDDADESLQEVIVQGDDQLVGQMGKELQLSEKGMVYVKGILER